MDDGIVVGLAVAPLAAGGMIGGFIGRSDIDIGSGRAAPSQSAIGIGISGGCCCCLCAQVFEFRELGTVR
eukprot:CAMPEP_0178636276 /NCGR_PEP_ID=MMETSP0698-20121128/13647_1 /TAXON_ID=265572 /ORGANISM="Extubocellulus spinifer, Strain CCMP396" /LENGTH=69 /DNA_ID=CAMNT_0020276139 /DNA_START=431 /DNA_END=640 /DNA_ORIENTATION=+